jgi:hypothetical protein
VEAGDPRIYADEYDLQDFALAPVQMASPVSALVKTGNEPEQKWVQRKDDERMAGQQWNEETFFARLAEIFPSEGVQAARRLYTFAVQGGAEAKWNAGPYASVTFHFRIGARLPARLRWKSGWMEEHRRAIFA